MTWVDRYGNVQLAAGPDHLGGGPSKNDRVTVTTSPRAGDIVELWAARVVHTYGDLASGELGLLVDSYGCLALCQNGARAADRLAIQERDVVRLEPPVAG